MNVCILFTLPHIPTLKVWVHILDTHLGIKIQVIRPDERQFVSQRNLRSGRLYGSVFGLHLA